jgi:hypothetical protein
MKIEGRKWRNAGGEHGIRKMMGMVLRSHMIEYRVIAANKASAGQARAWKARKELFLA